MRNRLYAFVIIAATALCLSACATVPQNAEQTVYATTGLYTAVSNTASDAYEQGTIDRDQFKSIDSYLNEARPKLDTAIGIVQGGGSLSDHELEIVRAVQRQLLQIQHRLEAKQ